MAVGTKPVRPKWVPFDGQTILDCDELLGLSRLPKSMIVVGADQDALESAMSFSVLGTRVIFVDSQPKLLSSWDRELIHRFRIQAEQCGVQFRLGRPVVAIEKTFDNRAAVRLEGGKTLLAERVLYAAGRCGNTSSLNLGVAGLLPDELGRLWCNEYGQTWAKHIYGVGDVVGFPTIADRSLEQSHRMVEHLYGKRPLCAASHSRALATIPELAMVGATEEQLRHNLVAYEVGVARFPDRSRMQTTGLPSAMLKLLFHRESFELLGVHCISESASDLIRLGEAVMSFGGTIESFQDDSVADSPLSNCYRLAAENGLARISDESSVSLRDRRRAKLREQSANKRQRVAHASSGLSTWVPE